MATKEEKMWRAWTWFMSKNVMTFSFLNTQKNVFSSRLFWRAILVFSIVLRTEWKKWNYEFLTFYTVFELSCSGFCSFSTFFWPVLIFHNYAYSNQLFFSSQHFVVTEMMNDKMFSLATIKQSVLNALQIR